MVTLRTNTDHYLFLRDQYRIPGIIYHTHFLDSSHLHTTKARHQTSDRGESSLSIPFSACPPVLILRETPTHVVIVLWSKYSHSSTGHRTEKNFYKMRLQRWPQQPELVSGCEYSEYWKKRSLPGTFIIQTGSGASFYPSHLNGLRWISCAINGRDLCRMVINFSTWIAKKINKSITTIGMRGFSCVVFMKRKVSYYFSFLLCDNESWTLLLLWTTKQKHIIIEFPSDHDLVKNSA